MRRRSHTRSSRVRGALIAIVLAAYACLNASPSLADPGEARVTGFVTTRDATSGDVAIDIAITGNASFAWHALPDNRWYVDLKPAILTIPSQTAPMHTDTLSEIRIKSFAGPTDDEQTVRIALSLDAPRDVAVVRTDDGLALRIGGFASAGSARSGTGALVANASAIDPDGARTPAPDLATATDSPENSASDAPGVPAYPSGGSISGFTTSATDDGAVQVDVALTGRTNYAWHRTSATYWYLDLKPATLTIPSQDVPLKFPALPSMRLKSFIGPHDGLPTVRIGLNLDEPRDVQIAATASGISLRVGDVVDDAVVARVGYGEDLDGTLVAATGPAPLDAAPTPAPQIVPNLGDPSKSRVIVIDPGHGGSDSGATHNGLMEKIITLDIAMRLQDLLVSRGWIVKMTRRSDVDVYQPNDSARDELQARCDIANGAHARLFVSIHVNSFTTSEQHGTTTYYYKQQSYAFAQAVHARLAATLPTTDDGILKANYYVIHHTEMPSILIETAFVSNPGDAAYLRSASFLQHVALGIADGIGDYTSGPGQPLTRLDLGAEPRV